MTTKLRLRAAIDFRNARRVCVWSAGEVSRGEVEPFRKRRRYKSFQTGTYDSPSIPKNFDAHAPIRKQAAGPILHAVTTKQEPSPAENSPLPLYDTRQFQAGSDLEGNDGGVISGRYRPHITKYKSSIGRQHNTYMNKMYGTPIKEQSVPCAIIRKKTFKDDRTILVTQRDGYQLVIRKENVRSAWIEEVTSRNDPTFHEELGSVLSMFADHKRPPATPFAAISAPKLSVSPLLAQRGSRSLYRPTLGHRTDTESRISTTMPEWSHSRAYATTSVRQSPF